MKSRIRPLFQIVATLSLSFPAYAVNFFWDGTSTSADADGGIGAWDTTSTNWDTLATAGADTAWPASGTDNDAVFGGTAGTITIDALGVTANSLTFNTANYILQGGKITLNGTTPTISNALAATINSEIAGTVGLVKTGAGILTLGAANTYTGATSINGGTLLLARSNAINTASTVNISSTVGGGTLRLATDTSVSALVISGSTSNQGTIVSDRATAGAGITHALGTASLGSTTYNFQAGSNVTSGVARISFSSMTLSSGGGGTTTLNPTTAALTIVGGVSSSNTSAKVLGLGGTNTENLISGVIANGSATSFGLTKSNSSTWTLTGANSYTGATLISGGILRLGAGGTTGALSTSSAITNNANLTINRSNAVVQGTDFSTAAITGSGSFTQAGTGTTTLNAANAYLGGTIVNGGTLLWSGANNLPTTGALQVNAGGSFSLGDGTARNTSTAALSLATGASLAFDWNGAALDNLASTAAATTTGNVGIIIRNTSPTGSGGTLITSALGGLTTTNGTKYFLANNTNFTAALTVSDTAVSIGAQTAATALTNAYWKGGQLTGALGAMALSSATTSNWVATIGGTTTGVVPGGSAVNVIFGATGSTQQANVTTAADMNLGSITFNDTAAVTIGGSNAITLNSTSATAASTTAALAAVTAGSAISVTAFANATNTINANVVLGANQTWNVASAKALNINGSISNPSAFSITKLGTGTLQLSNANTYSGGTIIGSGSGTAGGILAVTHAQALGAGAITINGSSSIVSTLQLSNGIDITNAGAISLSFSRSLGAAGHIQNLSGNNSLNSNLTLATTGTGGTGVNIVSTAGMLTLTGNLSNANSSNRPFVFTGGGDTTVAGAILVGSGGGTGVSMTGSGKLIISGNGNTYAGGTTVSSGTLLANNSTGSATGAGTVTVNGGTLGGTGSISGAVTINTTGALSPGASIESLGVGALTLNTGSTLDYEIDTTGLGTADLLNVNGNLNFDGTVTLSLTDLGSNSLLALGTKFTVISYFGTWDGDTFSGYADDSAFTLLGNEWLINYNDLSAGSVNGGSFTNAVTLTVIPEPRAALLGGLALLSLLRRRR